MTFDELMTVYKKTATTRKKTTNEEHRIQCACVRWFSMQYPQFHGRLFAVPNGGKRDTTTAAKLKAEGVIAGVADLILLKRNRDYGALLIEMKKSNGKQSNNQKCWQKMISSEGEYKYVVCHSIDEFINEINNYLANI